MLYVIIILLLVEITICIWIIGKIDSLKESVAKINNDIESSCFKGNLTEFRLSVGIFNKKFNNMHTEIEQYNDYNKIDKIIQTCIFTFSVVNWLFKNKKSGKKVLQKTK